MYTLMHHNIKFHFHVCLQQQKSSVFKLPGLIPRLIRLMQHQSNVQAPHTDIFPHDVTYIGFFTYWFIYFYVAFYLFLFYLCTFSFIYILHIVSISSTLDVCDIKYCKCFILNINNNVN